MEVAPTLPVDRAEAAWQELYAAEGSDWFWWYGDDFDTDYKQEFDRLFRTHLRNVWLFMGLTPPDRLNQPICAMTQQAAADRITQPVSILTPTIDGLVTDFFEWRGAGTITTHPPLGAMWKAEGLFTAIYFGWSQDHLLLRLDPDDAAQPRLNGLGMEITLHGPQHSFRLSCSLAPSGPESFTLFQQGEAETWQEIGPYRSISRRTILELAIPTKDLLLEAEQEVGLSLVILEHGLEVARYPHHTPAILTVPGPEFEAGLWRV